jgi:alpha-mannosidase
MSAAVPPASNKISESVVKLRQLSRVDVQSGWRYSNSDFAVSVNICNWQVAELNEKGHIAWPHGKQVLYLGQEFVIPDNLHDYPVTGLRLLLSLTWWAEDAQIFVNGELVGQGDLFDCSDRVLLTGSAIPGETFLVILRLVSPGHDSGALVRSTCVYEAADSDCLDPGFVADELEILQNSLTGNWEVLNLPYLSTEILSDRAIVANREKLQSEIARQVELIDWSVLGDRQKFDRSLAILRKNLLRYLRNFPENLLDETAESAESTEKYSAFAIEETSIYIGDDREQLSTSIYIGDDRERDGREQLSKFTGLKPPHDSGMFLEKGVNPDPQNLTLHASRFTLHCLSTSIYIGKIHLLGHAHLDLAWLWPIEETWSAAERTFESVLKLQAEFPDLIFCHSTPALYAWIEEHRSDLFAAIQKQVVAGRWEVVGGMWVEPDLNLISAESMVRQVFYGQRYAQEKFGELMRVVWLPDTFGFGWQLPQILRQSGIDYFVTQKLRWNDTTKFPHEVFWWEGLDGTKIFSMMSAAIGEGIESVKMANYTFDWESKTGLQAALWLPGVGDHGGGPTRDMLEVAKRWEKSPFFPNLQFAKAVDYLSAIESQFLPKIFDSESKGNAFNQENYEIPAVGEVIENLSKFETTNFSEISESESQADVLIRENPGIVSDGEVVENLSDLETTNFSEISESKSQADVLIRENPGIVSDGEVVENLSDLETTNFSEISESKSQADVLIRENPRILSDGEVVENLSDLETTNFSEISESKSQADVLIRENPRILSDGEVVGNLSDLETTNFSEISESESQANAATLPSLPIWQDELYLEFHRGCYTTRADQKRQNRRCEELLYQAELLSSLATIATNAIYPASELETAWKKVLFNQFHDILPGSAIAQVYIDANLAFAEVDRTCRDIVAKSLDAIASQISLPSPPQSDAQPILVFNTLNWSRSQIVSLPLPDSSTTTWQIYDLSGQRLVTQISQVDRPKPQFTLLFSANNIPAIGYKVFWLCREEPETLENSLLEPENLLQTDLAQVTNNLPPKMAVCQETHFKATRNVLENEFLLATVDWETGDISSIWDQVNHREILNRVGGNQLQAFQDSGQYWDAWNIDPNYQQHQLPPALLKDIFWIEQGKLRQSLRVVREIGKSEFCQDYIVETGSPLLKIKTIVDWQETHVLVKTAFGLNQSADFATCEIPGGAIARTTKPQTAAEKAKWEVPILRWTDISNDSFGVSLLNDCKYGCDIQPNQLRLTLLRSSTWPDEQADIGIHEFTYAVYPHNGTWQKAGTVRQGYELNLPLLVKVLPQLGKNPSQHLPVVGTLLDLSADNLVLMAFKRSEDNPNLWILRCYECHGAEAKLELNSDLGLAISQPVDLLEQPLNLTDNSDDGKGFKIESWKIASFAVNLSQF